MEERKLNFDIFWHSFGETRNPLCPINDGMEDMEHLLQSAIPFKSIGAKFVATVLGLHKIDSLFVCFV